MVFVVLGLIACGGGEAPPVAPEVKPEIKVEEKAPEPPKAVEKVDLAAMPEADRNAWLMKKGQEVYETGGSGGLACTTCHQPDGKGLAGTFPPLAGQKDLMGDCVRHAGFVVHGLMGEIVVDGAKYNGAMPAQNVLTDDEIAAVISFERNSFGNTFGYCMPSDVATARTSPAPTIAAPAP